MSKYIHNTQTHNTRAAEIVVPYLLQILDSNIKSVVDVGCGLGTWLKVFADSGIKQVCGYEGHHLNFSQVVIPKEAIVLQDLEQAIMPQKRYDLAISLEVAEHLKPEAADIFIKSLVDLSDIVVFSAAITAQGGQNHLNEQAPNYWREKFAQNGYECYDVLRSHFWANNQIDWWYRQNMVIYAKKGRLNFQATNDVPMYIHPDLYMEVKTQRDAIARKSGYNLWAKIKSKIR